MEGEGEIVGYINSELLTVTTKDRSCIFLSKDNKSYQKLLSNINVTTNNLLPPANGFSVDVDGVITSNRAQGSGGQLDGDQNHHVFKWNTRTEQKRGKGTSSWIKGLWSTEEDRRLMKLVKQYGLRKWAVIAQHMVGRIGKQCRERWQNHLRPDIKKSVVWTDEEEKLIIQGHEKFGNRWAKIAKCVPGRSENSIKNHWNATKRKQTSKRKIRRPERLRGLMQSTILEEYIKKMYFNDLDVSTTTTKTQQHHQPNSVMNHTYYDHDSASTYFLLETFDEEMDFMKHLFANKDINSDFSVSAQTIDVAGK